MRISKCIISVLATLIAGCAADTVRVTGGDGFEDGVLVDGTASGAVHNDDRATGPDGSAISVGPFDAGPGEIIAYTVGHAPTLSTPTWTGGNDTISFPFDIKYRVKFRIWVVQGPFTDGQTKALNACIRTSQIWRDERQGVSFSAFDITDATGNPNAAAFTHRSWRAWSKRTPLIHVFAAAPNWNLAAGRSSPLAGRRATPAPVPHSMPPSAPRAGRRAHGLHCGFACPPIGSCSSTIWCMVHSAWTVRISVIL